MWVSIMDSLGRGDDVEKGVGIFLERRAWRCDRSESWGATEENFEVSLGILPLALLEWCAVIGRRE